MRFHLRLDFFDQLGNVTGKCIILLRRFICESACLVYECLCLFFLYFLEDWELGLYSLFLSIFMRLGHYGIRNERRSNEKVDWEGSESSSTYPTLSTLLSLFSIFGRISFAISRKSRDNVRAMPLKAFINVENFFHCVILLSNMSSKILQWIILLLALFSLRTCRGMLLINSAHTLFMFFVPFLSAVFRRMSLTLSFTTTVLIYLESKLCFSVGAVQYVRGAWCVAGRIGRRLLVSCVAASVMVKLFFMRVQMVWCGWMKSFPTHFGVTF